MGNARVCAYCEKTDKLTSEHVFPDCFQRELEVFSTAKTASGEKAIASAQQIRDVCAHCNNDLLSPLDAYLCGLNSKYFATVVRPGVCVRFKYDFELLLRALLKIGYNIGRARNWPLEIWWAAKQYIVGNAARPLGLRLFLQLTIPTPVSKTKLPVSPGTYEIEPIPAQAGLMGVSDLPGINLIYSISLRSYRFWTVAEDSSVARSFRRRATARWLRGTKGAYELGPKGITVMYASSETALKTSEASPVFRRQLLQMRDLKSSIESRKKP
jgi:hypothetical protein